MESLTTLAEAKGAWSGSTSIHFQPHHDLRPLRLRGLGLVGQGVYVARRPPTHLGRAVPGTP